ncbi:uncharacterized protein LOC108985616 [Juglans regia]|uniref:Uncharacterized protein LOC108985616 n=1 Tax=Juglans regia TaxID=51240 RepID=A0A2I4E294_JUGRE|nr:uncharacterized protein LOC108985616 [Juglans regia]
MQLKESLTLLQRGDQSIADYLQATRTTIDELAMIDAPVSDDDVTLYVLNGLGSDYRDIVAPIRTRATSLSFEELHDVLSSHEAYLKRLETSQAQLVATANATQRHDGPSPTRSYKNNYQNVSIIIINLVENQNISFVKNLDTQPARVRICSLCLPTVPINQQARVRNRFLTLMHPTTSPQTSLTYLSTLNMMVLMLWSLEMVQVYLSLILVLLLYSLLVEFFNYVILFVYQLFTRILFLCIILLRPIMCTLNFTLIIFL